MGQVIRLAERTRRAVRPRRATGPLSERLYYCTRCGAESFILYPSGIVQCAGCEAQMENLAVRQTRTD